MPRTLLTNIRSGQVTQLGHRHRCFMYAYDDIKLGKIDFVNNTNTHKPSIFWWVVYHSDLVDS
jgi:hypothetical protein